MQVLITGIEVKHVVYKWGYDGGYVFDQTPSGFVNKQQFWGNCPGISMSTILVVLDPITAINIGLCTVQELNLPQGAEALFHLLNNGPPT
jgi:hypothetical protein